MHGQLLIDRSNKTTLYRLGLVFVELLAKLDRATDRISHVAKMHHCNSKKRIDYLEAQSLVFRFVRRKIW